MGRGWVFIKVGEGCVHLDEREEGQEDGGEHARLGSHLDLGVQRRHDPARDEVREPREVHVRVQQHLVLRVWGLRCWPTGSSARAVWAMPGDEAREA